ncbi:polysaccharide deacetylase family protein [Phycicoccus sp. 3266]|uniref:polysaccharide deacetylase family protein n=1 Tax=Phycicoccus sp. 3266 TaxID=2817751 RepID=UPI00285A324E|nr:polysaccharide deacetylase family protein [Phycicoccus sp. 3266]MDR6861767.1 peptidoglycan/xylan/chitin deacetylase (PgdA/CDA1 family) [Phycicoccus sp. 3266]
MSSLVARRVVLAAGAAGVAATVVRALEERDAAAVARSARGSSAGASVLPGGRARHTTRAAAARPSAPQLTRPSRATEVRRYAGLSPRAWGMDLPGITTDLAPARAVALTFDACGGLHGDGYDARLVDALRRHQVPATFFLNARWVRANRAVAAELASDPLFEVGSHGVRHVPLSVTGRAAYGIRGTADAGQVWDEVTGGVSAVEALTGRAPRWFRSGTAHYDDVALRVVRDLGVEVAGFDVNGDAGATFSPSQVAAQLATVRPGSVVISHVNHPAGGTAAGYEHGLPRLLERGLVFRRLSEPSG